MGIMRDEIGVEFTIKGFRILLKSLVLPEMTKGGIYLSQFTRDSARREYNIGLVVGIGVEAYKDKERFPAGPYCELGDWVFYTPHEKVDQYIGDFLCHFINDDRVLTSFPANDLPAIVPELRGTDWKSETKEAA